MKRKKLILHKDEKIIIQSRSSKWFLSFRILQTIFYWGMPVVIISLLFSFLFLRELVGIASLVSFLIVCALSLLYRFLLWKDPIFIVTNKRLVFDHQRSLWSSQRLEIKLENISDILSPKSGLLSSILGFGTISITPISGTENHKIMYMPNASSIAEKITEIYSSNFVNSSKGNKSGQEEEKVSQEVVLESTEGVLEVFEMSYAQKDKASELEDRKNRGVYEVLRRKNVWCALVNADFKYEQTASMEKNTKIFKSIRFKEIPNSICAFPGGRVHLYLCENFRNRSEGDGIVVVGA